MSHMTLGSRGVRRLPRAMAFAVVLFVSGAAGGGAPAAAQNEIVTENLLPGNPSSEWDVSGAGDPTIQGFATDISVDQGGTIEFKIDTDAPAYHLDIYRMGWYGGDGARKVATVLPSATLPQVQPAPLEDAPNGLVDCGNWAVSASWAVPADAVSGIYFARLVRDDTNGASHVVFVVRDDDGGSDLLFQTSDATWQAYNTYGGASLYSGSTAYPSGHATKVSYNRPFITRGGPLEDWVFNTEYPMVRWLERNGYDVSYTTNVDSDRLGAEILEHRVFLSIGHDEYWSANHRASVTAARDAGVHLAFLSGNEIYWKTRWEPSLDASGTAYRTLVCYKEGTLGENACGGKCDPVATTWTGLWRDGCAFTPPADGCNPENPLSGQISWVGTTGALQVSHAYKDLRLWRDTGIALLGPGQSVTLGSNTLGYEWNPEQFPESHPPGRVKLSTTALSGRTHHLALYRHASGAIVFGAGTVQWAWGLDGEHDRGNDPPVPDMQQATVNLFAEMGVQPATLMPGIVAATATGDVAAPVSTIDSPEAGASTPAGTLILVTGTATETGGGTVAGVEVSVDGGTTWLPATGGADWTFAWTPSVTGAVTLKSRAVDDWGNLEAPGAGVAVTVSDPPPPPPPPTEGPGGPILVVSAAANPFSRYPVEILRTEGLNAFEAMDLSLVTPAVLDDHDVVVLGECALTAAEVTMFADWVDAGGTLVAFRPDADLAPLLGIAPAAGTLGDAYLLVDTASGPGAGIVGQTMQFHGTADLYTLDGATAIATLYSDATTATAHPAVTTRSVGANGGRAIAFTYDLARSVVYTRQGNPAWAGTKRDGEIEPIRSDDQFFGPAAGDPQPSWIDFDRIAIPQADEQQRLLANAILLGNLHRMPLPRFWYLPQGHKAAVVMTGDNHGDGNMASRFEFYRAQSAADCSVDDWECVRATGYLYLGGAFTPAQAAFYDALGFETAMHINTGCARVTAGEYETIVGDQLGSFAAIYPNLPPPVSNRNHCIAWSDWSSVPEVEAQHGIRLDTNYYYWPASWVQGRAGFFTGSGMPMRFARTDGTLIDCYQAVTQMPDESGQSFPAFCNTLFERAQGPEGYYGVFTTNMHFDSSPHGGSDAIVASAVAHGVPVVSARQMLTWLDGRNGSSFDGLAWSGNQLAFSIEVGSGARNLRAMLPLFAAVGELDALTRDGDPVAFTTETVKGIAYATFPAEAGDYEATYLVDETAPVITAVTATPNTDGTAIVEWTTDEPADSHVDYGTAPGALGSTAGSAALGLAHAVTLSGLSAETTYHFRVRAQDAAGNESTEPSTALAPLSFTMPAEPCFEDRLASDFAQGDLGAGTAVVSGGDGGVALAAALDEEFDGVALPAGWTSVPWSGGGSTVVGGGVATVNGAAAYAGPLTASGRSLEFVATFQGEPFQNVGLAASGGFDSPWITVGTGSAGNGIYARSSSTGDVLLAGLTLGAAHHYRIDWNAGGFEVSVDGGTPVSLAITTEGPLLPILSDFDPNGLAVTVDWIRLGPYAASGSFTSRVFDSGGITTWGAATWSASVPAGTSLELFQRQGATPVPDGTWTAFTGIAASGATVGGSGRYLQYRADLATTAGDTTPLLDEIEFACTTTADETPPVISAITATPGAGGTTADVSWITDEPATSRVDYGTSPGALSSNVETLDLVVTRTLGIAGLAPGTTYHYRVTSVDEAGNSSTTPAPPDAPLSFVTPVPPAPPCAEDRVAADFAAGTHAGTFVAQSADGEVTLAPGLDVSFTGAALPAGWGTFAWTSGTGTATVSGGLLTVDGMRANPEPFVAGPGAALEFVATYSGDGFQHVGFGAGSHDPPNEVYNTTPWAMFSTGTGGGLQARTHDGGTAENVVLAGSWIGAPHLFRIEWNAGDVIYSIDGAVVHTSALDVSGAMRPAASDLNGGGGVVTVDWMRMTPYVASGTFESRVHDAGESVAWGAMEWTAGLPAGTSLALSARTGDDPDPNHASWSAYQPVPASGMALGLCARYLQYRAELATTDPGATPALEDVTVACVPSPAPSAIADLASARAPGAPDASGRLRLALTWSTPGAGGPVRVYRKGHGDYPTYRPGIGVEPVAPASPAQAELDGWTLTAIAVSGDEDLPPSRDVWSYVAFNTNACEVASAVSNLAGGTLDYVLGDFGNGLVACEGDNAVDGADLSQLGANYGAAIAGPADPNACMDVGPTVGFSTTGRPLPDGVLEFEDFVLCALNYTGGGAAVPPSLAGVSPGGVTAHADAVFLDPSGIGTGVIGERFVVPVRASGSGLVHALRLELSWDPAVIAIEGAEAGPLLAAQAARSVVLVPRPGRIDVALLGRGFGLSGEGELVGILCRRIAAGDPGLVLASVEARDRTNQAVALGGATPREEELPSVTHLAAPRPNPFHGTVTLAFGLAQAGPVDLALVSVDGRRIRTLARGERAAGTYAITWDGRNDDGVAVSAGVYYVRLVTASGRMTRAVTSLR